MLEDGDPELYLVTFWPSQKVHLDIFKLAKTCVILTLSKRGW